ncbi:hypothetical protein ACFXPY_32335 [Streptomyces sp. NPDC059153]|uniref:hypothetical protein n=1 Tax=Streptomyces sp. NPDC059153 TaxID=3346743 RepID=UPI003676797A
MVVGLPLTPVQVVPLPVSVFRERKQALTSSCHRINKPVSAVVVVGPKGAAARVRALLVLTNREVAR